MEVNGETKGFFKPSPAEGGARGAGRGRGAPGEGSAERRQMRNIKHP